MPQLGTLSIDRLGGSNNKLTANIFRSDNVGQKQGMITLNDRKLEPTEPMIFWADCKVEGNDGIVAVGWAQTMKMMVVEFCYATPTHGCIAAIDLTPTPCADGGLGIWYGDTKTAALQFLGSTYTGHDHDKIFFDLIDYQVQQKGVQAFNPAPDKKRAILSDAPFVTIPEDARCRVANRLLPVSRVGDIFTMGHGSPIRSAGNIPLLTNSQLQCVKARYRFETYFCALPTQNPLAVPALTQAPAYAKIDWGIDYCAPVTGMVIRKDWGITGPVKMHELGGIFQSFKTFDPTDIQRCGGVPCNQGLRSVVFDYRLLDSM